MGLRPIVLVRLVLGVVVRPVLWRSALRACRAMVRSRWWTRPPFLPVPAPSYLAFRVQTQYGGDGSNPPRGVAPSDTVDDVLEYVRWLRRW